MNVCCDRHMGGYRKTPAIIMRAKARYSLPDHVQDIATLLAIFLGQSAYILKK